MVLRMKDTQQFSSEEYYLWKNKPETKEIILPWDKQILPKKLLIQKKIKVGINVPWKRKFINTEFLNYEKIRIKKLGDWYSNFLKTKENKRLEETSFYTIPVEISTSWKGSIANIENYNWIGLSAFQNTPSVLLIAILPHNEKQPMDYRLINIIKSKKINLPNNKLDIVEPIILIEEWDYLHSDKIYVDVPHEERFIQKILNENLINENQTSLSFQSPIMSAPKVPGSIGGIALSSIAGSSGFAQELVKTIRLMVPPEYRGSNPPKGVYSGTKFQYLDGISFHLAERPYFDNNLLSSFYGNTYNRLSEEILKRTKFVGEYSIFSTLNPNYGSYTQIWKQLMKNFTDTEITLPKDIDELPYAGVDLTKLKKVIEEALWIQVVNNRQIDPRLDKEGEDSFIHTTNRLKNDFDVLLADIHKNETERNFLVKGMLHPLQYNLKRIAQSFARSNNKENISPDDFSGARDLIVDNFTGFINHPKFERTKEIMKKKKDSIRYDILQTELVNNPNSTVREIYDSIKSDKIFRDIHDLQSLLDWLHKKGHVIIDRTNRYMWVG